jgi:uncharacterized protein
MLVGVVALGLALSYGIGWLTRSDARAVLDAPAIPAAFDAAGGSGAVAEGGEVPGYREIYVNDYADLLDAGAEARVRADLIELYERTGIEMTVLTIEDMGSFDHQGTIESFATRLFNTWGIGNAVRNDGVLVLVSRFDREMRIELGSGYGRARDDDMKRVIDEVFTPAFRRDDYRGGIEAGVEETIFEVAGAYPGGYDSGTLDRGRDKIFRFFKRIGGWLYALIAVPAGAFALLFRRYLRHRPRPCPRCSTMMIRAGETEDDAHLEEGEVTEERLQSVDYDVWQCPHCENVEIKRHPSLFSRFEKCPACDYRTLSSTSETITPATTSSTGLMRVRYDCRQCDHKNSVIRTIPEVPERSSSSSGRSSFGGGSSSGGGASGSW